MIKVLSLFSGGGLGDYGLELAGMEIVGQVEVDKYCQKILKLRWPDVPKWKDVMDVKGEEVRKRCGRIDVVSGGFPCQPFSSIGRQKGEEDPRNMWPQMRRIIGEIKPEWILIENVRGIVKVYLDKVLSDLESLEYSYVPFLIPASAFNAPHKRERLFILANSRCSLSEGRVKQRENGVETEEQNADKPERPSKILSSQSSKRFFSGGERQWTSEPNMGRVAHGMPNRVDRLKVLGNGQVVQVVEWIGKRIVEFNKKGTP